MSKFVIAKVFVAGIGAFVVGLVLAQASFVLGDAGGLDVIADGGIVGVRLVPIGYVAVGLSALAALALIAGVAAAVVAWAAAMANARVASARGWFALLAVLGVPTVGVGAVVAYLLAGPDRPISPA